MIIPHRVKGIRAALASAAFLGLAPVFGKEAILLGFTPFAVVFLRTGMAFFLVGIIMLFTQRKLFYIYPLGLIGCVLAGVINGLGSIFYYVALARLNASIGQLIYSFYPLFVAFWLLLDRQSIRKLTLFRLLLAIPGIILLIQSNGTGVDLIGTLFMLISALLYALHLIINQRILFEVPAPTVTFYTLLAMSFTAFVGFLFIDQSLLLISNSWYPILGLAFLTFLSRITLFMGIKHIGGLQTAIIGLGELMITILTAHLWLGEILTTGQWLGAILLGASIFLVGFDRYTPQKKATRGILSWLNPPQIRTTELPWNSPL